MLATSLVIAWLLSAAAETPVEINAEDHGAGRYRIRVVFPGITDVRQAQSQLMPALSPLCKGEAVTLGRYTFEVKQALTGGGSAQMALTQDVQCGDAAPLVHDAAGRPAPTAADEAHVRADMARYLKARDAGDRTTLAALYSGEMKRTLLTDDALSAQTAFARREGEPTSLRLSALDWQDDPVGVEPGRYAAVDYVVDYPSGAMSCGYVGWRELAKDVYEIVRIENGDVDHATLASITPDKRAQVRRSLGCKD